MSKLFEKILNENYSAISALTPSHALSTAQGFYKKGKSNHDVKNFLQKYITLAVPGDYWSPKDHQAMQKIEAVLKRMGHTKIDAAPLEDWLSF